MMDKGEPAHAREGGSRLAFEQMCGYMAVAKVSKPRETIKGLVKLCAVDLDADCPGDAAGLAEAIQTLFSISVPAREVELAVDELVGAGAFHRPRPGQLVVDPAVREEVSARLRETRGVEDAIKAEWLDEVTVEFPASSPEKLWAGLRAYLVKAFRRHGLQTAALLDQRVHREREHHESLSALLEGVLKDVFLAAEREDARAALSGFMASVGSNPARAKYITQLADGAFNFFSLEVDPVVAADFRARLRDLTVFLDTNFLFGLLDLTNNPQVDLSKDLIRAAVQHKLPFRLRYHEDTHREMRNTIIHYGSVLKARHWPQAVSRAATRSRYISGIEQKYHEKNAVTSISPSDFLKPYEYLDEWLKEKGIEIYRASAQRDQERADLYEEYQEFLTSRAHRNKPYATVYHDAIVLDAVRQFRARAESSIEAGAILLSCDYWLYRFDWESARKADALACVMLPNSLWQILRPFIPADEDFERCFAETFALPEFRAFGSGAAEACQKMLSLLASYKDVPEETAYRLLTNHTLIDQLRGAKDSKEFEAQVESAFVSENERLMEEMAALSQEVEIERKNAEKIKADREEERREYEARVSAEAEKHGKAAAALAERDRQLSEANAAKKQAQEEAERHAREGHAARAEAKEALALKGGLERSVSAEKEKRELAERESFTLRVVAGAAVGLLAMGAFEGIVHGAGWPWLLNHPKKLGLQMSICGVIGLASVSLFVKEWRKGLWGVPIIGFIIGILAILDG